MNNTNKLLNNINPTNEITYPQVIFYFERKDYKVAKFLTVFCADFLDLIYLHNVIPPESPCAAIHVSVPTLNLLIIVFPTSINIKFIIAIIAPFCTKVYCHNCVL